MLIIKLKIAHLKIYKNNCGTEKAQFRDNKSTVEG